MKTIIVKDNGNEVINSDVKFRVIMGTVSKRRSDGHLWGSYSQAKDRVDVLKRIFKGYTHYDIVVVEVPKLSVHDEINTKATIVKRAIREGNSPSEALKSYYS